MYGLFGLNHHMLEKTCDVTPVTDVRTEEEESGKVADVWLTRNRKKTLPVKWDEAAPSNS